MMAFVRSVTVSEISLKIDGQGLPQGGAERYQGEIESAKALGRDAALVSRLGPEVDASVGRLEVEF